MKSKPKQVLSAFLAALALLWALPGIATARALRGTIPVTFYGLALQRADGNVEVVPQNPPLLCDIRLYDDNTLVMGDAGSQGGDTYQCVDSFSFGDQQLLAFQRGEEMDWLFLAALPDETVEILEWLIKPEAGVMVIPYDLGDTRRAREAEMAGGREPDMQSRIFDATVDWLGRRLSSDPFEDTAGTAIEEAGTRLFSGTYTEYGCLMRLLNLPDNRAKFRPCSPPRLCSVEARANAVCVSPANGKAFTLDYLGDLSLGKRTFRMYASKSGAEHVAFSPEGDVVYLRHVPNSQYMFVFYDRGDTRRARTAEMTRAPGQCPEPTFPQVAEVAKWAFAQPVRAVNPPPGGGGGGGGGGGALCAACHGMGTIKIAVNPHGMPGPYYCAECGGSSYMYHYHQMCMTCGGRGRI